jgi:phospholipase C
MMENRSFDNVLGYLRHPQIGNRGDVDGIEDVGNVGYINLDSKGRAFRPFWMADRPQPTDLPHDAAGVAQQLAFSAVDNRFLMTGFVEAYESQFSARPGNPPPMGLLRPGDLPTTSVLADRYTVCDRWFSCLPTSTAPNRLMSMCGTSALRETRTFLPEQRTVYDWLHDHGVSWRVYAAGVPFFALMPRVLGRWLLSHQFRRIGDLARDLAAGDRPQVIFIEPEYYDSPVHFHRPCDNHPPLGMAAGEAFVAQVYQTLAASPLWDRCVFIATYDEHGGFFDHVAPPPVRYRHPNGVAFETAGPRTPTIVAGPFARRGVSHALLDNTSILQLIAERFGSGEAYSPEVADRRRQGIASVSSILDPAAQNTEVCTFGEAAVHPLLLPGPGVDSELRIGFDGAIRELASRHEVETAVKYPELRRYVDAAGVRPDAAGVGPDAAGARPDAAGARPDAACVGPDAA